MKQAEVTGWIDLYYTDESGFSLTPTVPYAWQEVGQTISLPSQRSKRVNVLGFMTARSDRDNDLVSYRVEGSIDSEVFIACMNCRKPEAVVVCDNASGHRRPQVAAMIPRWQ